MWRKKLSKATMSRFPVYLKALRKMQHEGKETCLSSELFEITGIQDTTIRRDFTYLSKNRIILVDVEEAMMLNIL